MKVYLAAQYSRRDELRIYAAYLRQHGVEVTSHWLEETANLNGDITDTVFARSTAAIDIEDIERADAILFFAEDPLVGIKRGGRHVEFGYALALRKEIYTVGLLENVFHDLPTVTSFSKVEEALNYLVERNAN